MSIRTKFFVVGGDTLVIIDRLRDEFTGGFLDGQVVNCSVLDKAGTVVFGPQAMEVVTGLVNGRYRLSIPDSLPWVPKENYTLQITTTAGGRALDARRTLQAKVYSLEDS